MPHDPQMIKGILAPLLLHLLDQHEDYGYAVVARLRDAGFADLTEGTVYPALTRLERQGLLTATLRPSASGPARKYYATTAAGRDEAERLLRAWDDLARAVRAVIEPQGEP